MDQLTVSSPGEVASLHAPLLNHKRGVAGHSLSWVVGNRSIFQSAGVDYREIDNWLVSVNADASFYCNVPRGVVALPREPAQDRKGVGLIMSRKIIIILLPTCSCRSLQWRLDRCQLHVWSSSIGGGLRCYSSTPAHRS